MMPRPCDGRRRASAELSRGLIRGDASRVDLGRPCPPPARQARAPRGASGSAAARVKRGELLTRGAASWAEAALIAKTAQRSRQAAWSRRSFAVEAVERPAGVLSRPVSRGDNRSCRLVLEVSWPSESPPRRSCATPPARRAGALGHAVQEESAMTLVASMPTRSVTGWIRCRSGNGRRRCGSRRLRPCR